MTTKLNKVSIEGIVKNIREEHGFGKLPINPFLLAKNLEIRVEENSGNDVGISGALIKVKDDFTILYSTNINNIGFQNFSISHELGHYHLSGHPEELLKDGRHNSYAGFQSNNIFEYQADYFACCLLMPKDLFKREMIRYADGLEAIKKLSELCGASLTATAIRYAELSDTAASIIISNNNVIQYAMHTKNMKSIGKTYDVRKEIPVPNKSLTHQVRADKPAPENSREINLDSWFECNSSIRAKEEVARLGEYNKILTVISTNYQVDSGDDEEEEWEAPKFRR